jgi:hypothetical protein
MDLSTLDNALWAAGFIGHVALLCVLIFRGRWRVFPVFTLLVGFDTALTIALFLLYKYGSHAWYAHVYWSADVVDFGLQLGLVVEIARIVLRPTGTWVRDARNRFLLMGFIGTAVAAFLAWGVSPPGLPSKVVWEVRGSLFTSLVTCELVVAMAFSAARLGLGWRNHVSALAQGLGIWAMVAAFVDGIQSYVGAAQKFATLDHVRGLVYCCALAYWTVQFWIPEPARKPLSPEMRDYILALHQRVAYDLDRVDAES